MLFCTITWSVRGGRILAEHLSIVSFLFLEAVPLTADAICQWFLSVRWAQRRDVSYCTEFSGSKKHLLECCSKKACALQIEDCTDTWRQARSRHELIPNRLLAIGWSYLYNVTLFSHSHVSAISRIPAVILLEIFSFGPHLWRFRTGLS